jgi:hypothetical protein
MLRSKTVAIILLIIISGFIFTSCSRVNQVNISSDDTKKYEEQNELPVFVIPDLPEAVRNAQRVSSDFIDDNVPVGIGKKEGIITVAFRELLYVTGDFMYGILNLLDINVDTIIYNEALVRDTKIGNEFDENTGEEKEDTFTRKESPIKFSFRKSSKLPISILGYVFFIILRAFAFSFLCYRVIFIGRKFQHPSTIVANEAKEDFQLWLLSLVLLLAIPEIVELAIDIMNDYFLPVINPSNYSNLGPYTVQIRVEESFTNAVLYVASAVFTLYFLVVYISRALHIAVMYGLIPRAVLNLKSSTRKLFTDDMMELFVLIIIPMIDGIMFLGLVLLFSVMTVTNTFAVSMFKLLIGFCVIPLRGLILMKMGASKHKPRNELLGFASVIALTRVAGGAARGMKNAAGNIRSGISDISAARKRNSNVDLHNDKQTGGSKSSSLVAVNTDKKGVYDNKADTQKFNEAVRENRSNYNNTVVNNNGSDYNTPANNNKEENIDTRELYQRGYKKLFKGTGSLAGGAIGGLVGASAGLHMGVNGMAYGAALGGFAGSSSMGWYAGKWGEAYGDAAYGRDYIRDAVYNSEEKKPEATHIKIQPVHKTMEVANTGETSVSEPRVEVRSDAQGRELGGATPVYSKAAEQQRKAYVMNRAVEYRDNLSDDEIEKARTVADFQNERIINSAGGNVSSSVKSGIADNNYRYYRDKMVVDKMMKDKILTERESTEIKQNMLTAKNKIREQALKDIDDYISSQDTAVNL